VVGAQGGEGGEQLDGADRVGGEPVNSSV
jgi:hypothetical protein